MSTFINTELKSDSESLVSDLDLDLDDNELMSKLEKSDSDSEYNINKFCWLWTDHFYCW